MSMPEAAVHENHGSMPGEDDVRPAHEELGLQSETKTKMVQNRAHGDFRTGVPVANGSHISVPLFGRKDVHGVLSRCVLWVDSGIFFDTGQGGFVAQIHVKLDDEVHAKLLRKAKDFNFSLQDYAEQALMIASEVGLDRLCSMRKQERTDKPLFTFIDLFAGIGGTRLAFQAVGGRCVFSSEWDRFSQKTYMANFGDIPEGDITKIEPKDIPDHDILVGGFPCQPFSIAGVSKKNSLGREHGFKDKTQGTLFFNVAEIIEKKRPKMFLLENVKNLRNHDKGNTFRVISEALSELGYHVFVDVIDAKAYVPQHRERIFIVGFDKETFTGNVLFKFPEMPEAVPKLKTILERKVDKKYILTDHLWQYLQNYAAKHKAAGNGFGFGLVNGESTTRTLSARYHKDGSEILIEVPGSNPRRLTPRECARLMGFPPDFKIVVSDTQAYRQFGNSVVVPVVKAIAEKMIKTYQSLVIKEKQA
jgi:DNA (cytosine-5)-methyltransferase 1